MPARDTAVNGFGERIERMAASLAACFLLLLLAACVPGQYPIEVFPDLHYQPSQRRLEPTRGYPPARSVPISGRAAEIGPAEMAMLTSPITRTAEVVGRGAALYAVNCSFCHGPLGHGDGAVGDAFRNAGTQVANLTAPDRQAKSDGVLYRSITNGLGVMPPFRNLLTDEERWSLVAYVRELGGRR
ncbi:MAG: cytochrome c [Chloroflexi bacterium]|nr:cytochrome c [Chloroflexota bacterium]